MVSKHRGKESSRILNSPQSDKRFKTIYSTKYSRTERAVTNITNESFRILSLLINCNYPRERPKIVCAKTTTIHKSFVQFKDSLEHIDAEKFSNILFLSYLTRVDVYLAVVKFITNTLSYNLLHFAVVCDVINTCQDFDSWSKGYPSSNDIRTCVQRQRYHCRLIVSQSQIFPVLHTIYLAQLCTQLSRFTSRSMKTYYSRDVFRLGRIVLVGPHQSLHNFD